MNTLSLDLPAALDEQLTEAAHITGREQSRNHLRSRQRISGATSSPAARFVRCIGGGIYRMS